MSAQLVRIGPKKLSAPYQIGMVEKKDFLAICLAEKGRNGNQLHSFNLLVKHNPDQDGLYIRAFVVNGHCQYKKYTLLDVLLFKIYRMIAGSLG